MPKEQTEVAIQAILGHIKDNPRLAIPSEKELKRVRKEREEADWRIKESGRTVIL